MDAEREDEQPLINKNEAAVRIVSEDIVDEQSGGRALIVKNNRSMRDEESLTAFSQSNLAKAEKHG